MRSALEDLEATVRLLQRHAKQTVGAENSSEACANNARIIPEIDLTINSLITTSHTSLRRELDQLNSRLPKPRAKAIGIKLRWMLDKQQIMEAVSSIESHKSTLLLVMSGLGL